MEKKNPDTRSCASFMLEILLDALPSGLGNQPTKIGLIFARYFLWSNQDGPVDTIATSWKKERESLTAFSRNSMSSVPRNFSVTSVTMFSRRCGIATCWRSNSAA